VILLFVSHAFSLLGFSFSFCCSSDSHSNSAASLLGEMFRCLSQAAKQGHWSVVELLLGNGANFASPSNDSSTALRCARDAQNDHLHNMISAHITRYVCAFVCLYVCAFVCLYGCECLCVCVWACMDVCVFVSVCGDH
jgi:hypothetical protein